MKSNQWLLLDNLMHSWPAYSGMNPDDYDQAFQWAADNLYVDPNGHLTDLGRGYFLLHRADPIDKGRS